MKPTSSKAGRRRAPTAEIITGCQGVCNKSHYGTCRTCGRTNEEAEQWHTYDHERRKAVMRIAKLRITPRTVD